MQNTFARYSVHKQTLVFKNLNPLKVVSQIAEFSGSDDGLHGITIPLQVSQAIFEHEECLQKPNCKCGPCGNRPRASRAPRRGKGR